MDRVLATGFVAFAAALAITAGVRSSSQSAGATLDPRDSVSGYIARLLINEAPFPGERGWVSEADTKAGMLAILWVLHCRIECIPPGYRQEHIATLRTNDIIDVITAGGERGQVDGFYRDRSGRFVAVSRVHERIDYLARIANTGKPGRFKRLLDYAQMLGRMYAQPQSAGPDRFERLRRIGAVPVTGHAFSWMTDKDFYNPGGNYVRIPDESSGALGGNRFFTLRRLQ